MDERLDRVRGSRAVRVLFAALLAIGLWPAASLASPAPAYADESTGASVDVEGYVRDQADPEKVGEEKVGFLLRSGSQMHGTGRYLTVKHTYAQSLEEGDTIDSVMTDIDQMAAKFIGVGRDYAQIYEVEGEAEYYVAFVAPSAFNGASAAAVDFVAALNGTDGHVVEGVEFDAEKGLAYIPKSLLQSEECEKRGLQIQTLEPASIDEAAETSFEVSIDNGKPGVTAVSKSQTVTAQRYDSTIEFQVATADTAAELSLSDMSITINDGNVDFAPQGEDGRQAAGYDPATGRVWVAATPATVASVQVSIDGSGLFGAKKAYAATPAEMNALPDIQFTGMDLSQVWVGDTFRYTGPTFDVADFPDISWWRDNYLYLPNFDGRGWPTNANGQWVASGSVSGDEDIYEIEEEWSTGSDEMHDAAMISGTHTSEWGATVDFSYTGSLFDDHGRGATWGVDTLPGYCAHVALAGTSPNFTGSDGSNRDIPIICRVLAKGDDWVVLGFAQSMIYNQAGFGAYKFKVQSKGDLEIRKSSGNAEITDGNPCYSLEGATFDVYDSNHAYVTTITTDAEGYGKAEGLKAGRYYLKETKAPDGYLVNAEWEANGGSDWVNVPGGGTGSVECVDQPGNDPDGVLLQKVDAETGEKVPQGASSLAMAEYTFEYYAGYYQTAEEARASGDPARTWVLRTDADGFCSLRFATDEFDIEGKKYPYFVTGDDLYKDAGGYVTVPLGTVVTHETKAPEGYNISDKVYVSRVVMDAEGNTSVEGDVFPVDGNTGKPATVAAEQPKRGDLRFVKRDAETGKTMPGVPFLVTSRSTGERHVAVTDANGAFDSSLFDGTDSYNASDAALSGDAESGWKVDEEKLDPAGAVWFGGEAEKGASGAFLYDTYDIEELACSANEGRMLASATAVVTRDSKVVDLGEIVDPTIHVGTRATAADGSKELPVLPEATLVDRVEWGGGQAGADLFVTTQIKDMATREAVTLSDGSKSIETKVEDAPAAGSVSIEASFSTLGLAGRTLYVAETVKDSKGRVLAEHDDADDTEQQVGVVSPEIGTTLSTPEGEKALCASKHAVLVDVVAHENLAAGVEHVVSGELRDKATGELLLDADGEAITASAAFTPEKPSGSVEVTFEFDGSNIASDVTAVAFEEVSVGGHAIAEHKDIEDGDQSAVVGPGTLGTELLASGSHSATAAPDATLVDTVSFEKLPEAQLEGWGILMDASTGLPFVSGEAAPGEEALSAWFDGVLAALGAKAAEPSQQGAQQQEGDEPPAQPQQAQGEDAQGGAEGEGGQDGPSQGGEEAPPAEQDPALPPAKAWTCRGEVDWGAVKAAFDADPAVRDAVSTASAQFQGGQSGSYSLEFPCDLTAASGKSLVALEIAVRHADDGTSEVVGSHADLSDKGQTVDVGVPEIGTELVDSTDGDHSALASTACMLVDTVRYEGLTPGLSYTVAGELRDKATGEVVEVAGKPVTAEATFVPNTASGSVEVEFSLDASKLGGATVVAFEELSLDGTVVAEHKDISDEAQSVSVENPPLGAAWDKTGGLGFAAVAVLAAGALAVAGLCAYAVRQRRFAKRGGLFREPEER